MEHIAIGGYDVVVILVYMIGIVIMGTYFSKYVDESSDFFLGGRMLPWWAIGMSLVSTDISSLDFVSAAGNCYIYGIAVANFDWIGALPPVILAAFIFVPYYWRTGIYTIPEYLGRRYNQAVRTIHAGLWGLFMVANLAIMFWATGLMFQRLIPLPNDLLGGYPREIINAMITLYPNSLLASIPAELMPLMWQILLWIFVIGVCTAIYTMSGGLAAVVMTDAAQLIIMFVGGGAVILAGLYQLGGIDGLVQAVHAMGPQYANHFNLILPADSPTPYPWTGIVFGLMFVLAPAYWLGNQVIIQRTLGARTEWDAKAGVLWAGFLHLLIPLLVTIPGMIGLALYSKEITIPDMVYPHLIRRLLPSGMMGLVFAAFLAAMMSTVSSILNSAATIWTKDIYQNYIVKRGTDRHYLIVGIVITMVFVILGMTASPIVNAFQTIYQAIQNFLTFIQGPSLALILLGMLWRRTTGWGGLAGLVSGLCFSTGLFSLHRYLLSHGDRLFRQDDPFLYIAWWSFVGTVLVTVIVSLLTKRHPDEKLEGLVFDLSLDSPKAQAALERRVEK